MPDQFRAAPIDFIAQLQAITVVPDSKARVVMNERTGTIVATSRVKELAPLPMEISTSPSIRAQKCLNPAQWRRWVRRPWFLATWQM